MTYVCEKCNNFQDSKSIFMNTNFRNFSNNAFEMAESCSWWIVGLTTILWLLQRWNSTFLDLLFFLLLSERGLRPVSCLAIWHPGVSCWWTGCFKKTKCTYTYDYIARIDYFQKQPLLVFCKKDALKNFANFTGKQLCWSIFLIKLLQLYEKETPT